MLISVHSDEQLILYKPYDYLSMLILKLISDYKGGPWLLWLQTVQLLFQCILCMEWVVTNTCYRETTDYGALLEITLPSDETDDSHNQKYFNYQRKNLFCLK